MLTNQEITALWLFADKKPVSAPRLKRRGIESPHGVICNLRRKGANITTHRRAGKPCIYRLSA